MAAEYPFYSPYSFSGNKVIHRIELEGREDAKFGTTLYDSNIQNLTSEEIEAYHRGQTYGLMTGGYILMEVFVTKGQATKFLLKQYTVQLALDSTVKLIVGDDISWSIFEDNLKTFDFADSGIDKAGDLVLDKYKVGLIKDALKIYASSIIDVTKEGDGLQVMKWSKDSDKIIGDILSNVLGLGIDKAIGKGNDIPITKINKETLDKATAFIKEAFTEVVLEVSTGDEDSFGENKREAHDKDEEKKLMNKTNDAIPKAKQPELKLKTNDNTEN
jgi:hypothetical protein